MNSTPNSRVPNIGQHPPFHLGGDDLEHQYFSTSHATQNWQEVWELFYVSPWFRWKLGVSVRRAARNSGLGADCYDDIQQEALIEFARAIQRNASLGFDPSKGSFRGFLSTVLYRCSLKGLRQFRRRCRSLPSNYLHPNYEDHLQLERLLDFRDIAAQIPEPYRGVIGQLLAGETVGRIARSQNRSERTIYRWIDRSIALLKIKFLED